MSCSEHRVQYPQAQMPYQSKYLHHISDPFLKLTNFDKTDLYL